MNRNKPSNHPLLNPPLDVGGSGLGLVHAELRCALCGGGSKAEAGALGPLLGPINIASSSAADGRHRRTDRPPPLGRYAHRLCALWCPEVFQGADGAYRRVAEAVKRARQIKCALCGKAGAATGCRVHSCPRSYHLPCARDAGCAFNGERFELACPEHAPMFSREAGAAGRPAEEARREDEERPPARNNNKNNKRARRAPPPRLLDAGTIGQRLAGARAALERAVAEERDPAVAEALRAVFGGGGGGGAGASDAAAPHPPHHHAGDEDDEAAFRRKEARRDAKDRARLAPIILGGAKPRRQRAPLSTHGEDGQLGGNGGNNDNSADQQQWQPPEEGLQAVGGLNDAKRQLFEAAVLPLCHPALVDSLFGSSSGSGNSGPSTLAPPRGVLLHGPPGTGKTHLVRAVAGEIARRLNFAQEEQQGAPGQQQQPHQPRETVALFARKGADCLGKYAGDAERSLRLLFDEATRLQPSIIFLDELDALAPARAARSGTVDQTYASVVATLLALMDGADAGGGEGGGSGGNSTGRGRRVVVVAATNRPDAIDPALRRPGRFDREVYVGLPSAEERADILRVMTRGWPCLPSLDDGAARPAGGGDNGEQQHQHQHQQISPLPSSILQELAAATEGYAGADLKALCTGAVMAALKRCAPRCLAAGAEGRASGRAPPLPLTMLRGGSEQQAADEEQPTMEEEEEEEQEEEQPPAEAAEAAAAAAPAPAADGNGNSNAPPNFLDALRETLADLRSPGAAVVAVGGGGGSDAAAQPGPASSSPSPMQEQEEDAAADAAAADDDETPQPPPTQQQLVVLPRDWRAALASAPPPASLRGADAGPSAGGGGGPGSGSPLPSPLAPLLLPALARALASLHASGLPLPRRGLLAAAAADAARVFGAAADHHRDLAQLARLLRRCGAVEKDEEELEEGGEAGAPSATAAATAPQQPTAHGPQCRLLLSGGGDSGQSETAAALLRAVRLGWQPPLPQGGSSDAAAALAAVFPPPVVAALTLPSLLLRGGGDPASGCASMVKEALARCSGPRQALVLFVPCLEAWAVAPTVVVVEGEGEGEREGEGDGDAAEAATPATTTTPPTLAWTVFERALVDAPPDRPILVVATTQAPASLLPEGVRRFFAEEEEDGDNAASPAATTAAVSTAFARAARAAASRAAAFLRERASDLALAAAGRGLEEEEQDEQGDDDDENENETDADADNAAATEKMREWAARAGLNAAQREVADRALAHALSCTSALGRALLRDPTWARALDGGGGNNNDATPTLRAVAERAAEGGYCCLDEMLAAVRCATNAARRAAGLAAGAVEEAQQQQQQARAAAAAAAAAATTRPRRATTTTAAAAAAGPSTPPPPPPPPRYSRAAAAAAAAEDMAEAALAEASAGMWAAAVGAGEGGGGGSAAAALLLPPPLQQQAPPPLPRRAEAHIAALAELRRLLGLAQEAWRAARLRRIEEQMELEEELRRPQKEKKKKSNMTTKRRRLPSPPSSSSEATDERRTSTPSPSLTPLAALLVGPQAEATADALEAAIALELRRLLLPAAAKAAAEAAAAEGRGGAAPGALVPALRQLCRAVGPAWWEATAARGPFDDGGGGAAAAVEEEAPGAGNAAVVAAAARRAAAAAARALA
jgi:SpoVK/Ycf46/Vps4 family AAA+-type ATPase